MELKPVKRDLEERIAELLAPVLDGSLADSGWKLISYDAEQGICLSFQKRNVCLLLELEDRNEALDCYVRTSRFNVCVRRQFGNPGLSDADREFVDRIVAIVREREASLPDGQRPASDRKTVVREILVDRVLIPQGKKEYYINPYVGCMIACPFCYVIDRADFSRRLEGLPELPWGRYLDVKINAAEVLRQEVKSVATGIVRMSPLLTDPYQPAEKRYRITRQCLEVLADTELTPVVLTRARRILEDAELLRRSGALVGLSIPTDADEYRQIFEPDADTIEDRLEALRFLHKAGVRTFAVIQPVLPMNIERLVDAIAPFARAVRIDGMHVTERAKQLYSQHGLDEYATKEFADETIRNLTRAFKARGVRV